MTLPAAHTHLENTRQHLLRLAAQHQQARAAGTEAGGRREGGGWRGCSVLLRAAARPTQQGCQGSRLAWHHPRPAQPACPVGAPPAPPPVCRRLCKLPHLASRSARLSSRNCTRFTPILQSSMTGSHGRIPGQLLLASCWSAGARWGHPPRRHLGAGRNRRPTARATGHDAWQCPAACSAVLSHLSGCRNQGSKMNTGQRWSAPWAAASSAGLSCRRSPWECRVRVRRRAVKAQPAMQAAGKCLDALQPICTIAACKYAQQTSRPPCGTKRWTSRPWRRRCRHPTPPLRCGLCC